MKRRFHIFGLAHQPVTGLVPSCAYTMKVRNMCIMAARAGHEVHLYHAGCSIDPMEGLPVIFHQMVSDSLMEREFGVEFATSYNQAWTENDRCWQEFRRRTSIAIGRNLTDQGDIVLASFGSAHQGCCPPSSAAMVVEMGVGYEGVFAQRKVWESYAWRHYMYGQRPTLDPSMDTVIPGYYRGSDFRVRDVTQKAEHFLFLGRVVEEKGVLEAYQAALAVNAKLVIAGPGDPVWIKETMPKAEYVGMVNCGQRRDLLDKAIALVCFTKYIEPFGNVAVEAMASGVPVISSNWGAFTETVIPGRTGYRCSNVRQMIAAMIKIRDGQENWTLTCPEFAANFELAAIWPRYENYFEEQHAAWK